MKKHIVTCVKCGRQFDANEGGAYYPESRRYVCKHCVDKQKDIQKEQAKARKAAEREAEADERERVTGMRQSKAAMLVKIVVGVLFLFAAVSLAVQGNISSFVCGLVIGGFSKRLKSMSGFRLGVGLRLTRRNCWYFLFVLVLVGCFYFCWYSVLACGWMLYGLFYGLYLMFKYAAIGTKKLYTCIKGEITHVKH